jgi:hypothetical protein
MIGLNWYANCLHNKARQKLFVLFSFFLFGLVYLTVLTKSLKSFDK